MGDFEARSCPVCGSTAHTTQRLRHRTPLQVAGIAADFGNEGFSLLRCDECTLAYKDPLPPQNEIERCYRLADAEHWAPASAEARRFDELLAQIGTYHPSGRVLDVGCGAGDFLSYLPEDYQRFGIEPGEHAARVAHSRHITILGPDVEALQEGPGEQFEVVVAFDVLEHVPEPIPFLTSLRRALVPGGVVCLLTGNTDCLGWRLEGGDYWYSALPEHLVFFNRASLERAAIHSGLEVVEFRTTRHSREHPRKILSEALRNAIYIAAQRSRMADRFGETFNRSAPVWHSGRNHFVAILRAAE